MLFRSRDVTISMAGGNVGGYVNACMLHSMIVKSHRPVQLCSLETAIDKCINPDDVDDVKAIDAEARLMVREAIEANKPIDETFWTKRGLRRFLNKGETIETCVGPIGTISRLCDKYRKQYVADIRSWSQDNARPDEIVHEVGRRMYFRALPHLRNFRMGLFNSNSSEQAMMSGGIERNSWEEMYQGIVDIICSYERFEDRCDFVLGLYSVTMKNPTSAGKITDQLVMNRFVYPYLERALQFYGIANITMYDGRFKDMKITTIRNTEWFWPDQNGTIVPYDNPLEFQKAHAKDSPVVWKMP